MKKILPIIMFLVLGTVIQSYGQCSVSAGPDDSICANVGHYTLNGASKGSGIVSVTWTGIFSGTFSNNTSVNPTYTFSSADIALGYVFLVINGTGCGVITDTMKLVLKDNSAISNAGPDQVLCVGDSVHLNGTISGAAGSTWSTNGNGTFVSNTTLNTWYKLSAADTLRSNLTFVLNTTGTQRCHEGTDTLKVTLTQRPHVDAGLNRIVCGDTVRLAGHISGSTGAVWTSSGNGHFSNNISLNATYTASSSDKAAGQVTLTLTTIGNGVCQAEIDKVTVKFTSGGTATINAGADQTICGNKVYLHGSVQGASSGYWTTTGTGTFSPSNKHLHTVYTISAADIVVGSATFTLHAGGDNCITTTDEMTATFNQTTIPSVHAGLDQIISAGNNVQLHGTVQNATGATWTSTGTGTFSSNSNLNASYIPSNADRSHGSVLFKLTSTGNGACDPVYDYVLVTFGNHYSISGTIIAGSNPIDHAKVILFKRKGANYDYYKEIVITTTDAGMYEFDSLSNGSYLICAIPTENSAYDKTHLPTYFTASGNWSGAAAITVNNANTSGKNITLTPFTPFNNTWDDGDDEIAGMIEITNAVLAGGNTHTALGSAVVFLKTEDGMLLDYTTTDENGFYSFENVTSGNYLITYEYGGTSFNQTSLPVTTDGDAFTVENGSFNVSRTNIATGIFSPGNVHALNFYPNPARQEIIIEIPETITGNFQVNVLDGRGMVVNGKTFDGNSENTVDMNVDLLPSGIYLIQITSEDQIFSSKLIKY